MCVQPIAQGEHRCCKHMHIGKSFMPAAAQAVDSALQMEALLSVGTAKCCLQCQSPATAQLCLRMLSRGRNLGQPGPGGRAAGAFAVQSTC